MNRENRILIVTGVVLSVLTMFFGVRYAAFEQHQATVGMSVAMENGFLEAANKRLPEAYGAMEEYGRIALEHRRQVHFHGHWGFLGLILILYGLVAHTMHYGQSTRFRLASCLAASAVLFPLGVMLQTGPMDRVGEVLAMLGSMGLVLGMLAVVMGLWKGKKIMGPE